MSSASWGNNPVANDGHVGIQLRWYKDVDLERRHRGDKNTFIFVELCLHTDTIGQGVHINVYPTSN